MTEGLDASTLLSASDVKHIVQFALNPAFIYSGSNLTASVSDGNRTFCLHFYTGRPPTAGEVSLQHVLDRLGDSHQDRPLALKERYLGGFTLDMAYTNSNKGIYQVGSYAQTQAARFYKNVGLPALDNGFKPMPQLSRSNPDVLLEWRFRNNYIYRINSDVHSRYGNRSFMEAHLDAGKLVHGGRPTWFCITFEPQPPHFRGVDYSEDPYLPREITDPSGKAVAIVERLSDHLYNFPVLIGTVGAVGSGEDLEVVDYDTSGLATGLRLISLRVVAEPMHE